MPVWPPRTLAALLLAVAAVPSLTAQVPDFESQPDPVVEPEQKASSAQAEVDAKVASLRGQLAATTEGTERYRLQNEIIRVLDRAGRGRDSLVVQDAIVEDASIGPGRRSLMASALGSTPIRACTASGPRRSSARA